MFSSRARWGSGNAACAQVRKSVKTGSSTSLSRTFAHSRALSRTFTHSRAPRFRSHASRSCGMGSTQSPRISTMPYGTPWQQDAQQGMGPGNKQAAIASSETEARRNPAMSRQTPDTRSQVSTSIGRTCVFSRTFAHPRVSSRIQHRLHTSPLIRRVPRPMDVQFYVSAPTQGYVYVLKRGGSLLLCNNGRAFLETR